MSRVTINEKSPGQVAYEAYSAFNQQQAFGGRDTTARHALPERIRQAWIFAGRAVVVREATSVAA